MMRVFYPLILMLIAATVAATVAGAQPAEPPMEALVLSDGDNDVQWNSAEATMEPDATHARSGQAMRFHVDVNHETGEPNYPIGWPRTYITVPEDVRDWSKWDFIDFWVYTETSREALPSTPLGFIVRCPDKANSSSTTLSDLRIGDWAHFRFPVADLPNPADCTGVQFYISESNYNHGDVLDFWIDDLALLRYAQPTIISAAPLNRVHYADVSVLRVRVELTGMEDDERAEVLTKLVRNGSPVRQSSARLGPGVHTIPLDVGADTAAGDYEVQTQIVASDRTLTAPVRIVSSPWEAE